MSLCRASSLRGFSRIVARTPHSTSSTASPVVGSSVASSSTPSAHPSTPRASSSTPSAASSTPTTSPPRPLLLAVPAPLSAFLPTSHCSLPRAALSPLSAAFSASRHLPTSLAAPRQLLRCFSAPDDYDARLSVNAYHRCADLCLDALEEAFEPLEEEAAIEGFDCELSDGVLTLRLGNLGTYVINKQAPNKQLWLSSPIAGPKRYYYDTESGQWKNTRDNHELLPLLSAEIEELTGTPVEFNY